MCLSVLNGCSILSFCKSFSTKNISFLYLPFWRKTSWSGWQFKKILEFLWYHTVRICSMTDWQKTGSNFNNLIIKLTQYIIPLWMKWVGELIEIRHKKISPTRILSTRGCLSLCHSVTLFGDLKKKMILTKKFQHWPTFSCFPVT